MSNIFNNFESNGAGGENLYDIIMVSPSQYNSMANSNTNLNGGAPGTSTNMTNNTSFLSTSSVSNSSASENQPILTKPRLLELVREVDTTAQLDEDVQELLLQIADDFIEDTVKSTCAIAKHRKDTKVEVRDVQLHLGRKWNMWIPGYGTDELRPCKRAAITEAHKQRLALIRKKIKKY